MTPNGSKNVVQFDVNGRKWKKTGHEQLRYRMLVPGIDLRNFARNLVSTAGGLELLRNISADNSTHDGHREVHKQNNRQHQLQRGVTILGRERATIWKIHSTYHYRGRR